MRLIPLLHAEMPMSRPSPAVPRSFVRAAARSLIALSLMGAAPLGAQAVREPVIPAGQSASATLTPGIKIGNFIFASGQLGMSREAPDTTVGGQTRIAL